MRILLATILVLALAASSLAASADPDPAGWLAGFKALPPADRVTAHRLLGEWAAATEAAAATGGVALRDLAAAKQTALAALLPQLSSAAAGPRELLPAAEAALAAALAPAPGRSRLARALTLVNVAWFAGCVLLALAAAALASSYIPFLLALLTFVPVVAWEAAGYGVALAVLRAAGRAAPATAPYLGLTGLLLLTACVGGTAFLHFAERLKDKEAAAASLMGFFALLYGAVAIRLQASLLGTLAVWWAVSALGFSIFVFPFLTVIGFRNGLRAPFAASLALVALFTPFKAFPEALPTPAALRPFETGVWLWCVLVLNVANLIMSHRQWNDSAGGRVPAEVWAQLPLRARLRYGAHVARRCLASQVPAVAVLGGTLAAGLLLDVEPCRALGAAFGFLWFLSKLAQCDWAKVGAAWTALILGGLLWGGAYAVHSRAALAGAA